MFRREALEHLNTPEGLDQLMEVTRPTGWLALIGLGAVVLLFAGWGFYWKLPTKLTTTGIVAPVGGVQNLVAPLAGQVQKLSVKTGDIVTPGESIAQIVPTGGGPAVDVTAPDAGSVIAVSVNPGDVVESVATVATIEPVNKPLELVMFVPLSKANQLRPGLEVQTTAQGIPLSAFGFLKGTIQSVGTYPATKRDLQQALGTDEVVNQFMTSGPVIEVHVALKPDANTKSGYSWSTPKGPPFPLNGGTFANSTVILNKQTPFKIAF
jgi:hypothetical protein